MNIRAIGFDIDGTLYANFRMYLHSFPSGIRHPLLYLHFAGVRKDIRAIRPVEDFRRLQATMLAERMNVAPARAFAMMEEYLYRSWERSFRGIKPLPYVRETLELFRVRGLRLGALSDFPVQNKLKYLGLEEYWDAAFSSEETQYLKPHPEAFLRLSEALQTEPGEILYVGNSYRYDVEGAKAAGMLTAHYSARPHRDSAADLTFSDYRDLQDFVFSNSGI